MSTPIEQQPYRTQIARFRALAVAALTAYDLPPARLTLIHHRGNTTFRVDTATGARYALRIHRFGSPTVERVGAELAWLAALRRDTPLEVPDPLPTRAGSLFTLAATPAIPTSHICDLLRWLPGHRRLAGQTPSHLERVGALTAHLHEHTLYFDLPPDVSRGRVDTLDIDTRLHADPFAPEVVAAIRTLVTETLSAAEAEMVVAVIAHVRAAEEALGHDPLNFGLIHADLHQYNLLFARNTVRPIDFDDCGFGPRLYDPAVTLYMFQGRPNYPALRAAYLAGYRRVRPLSAAHEALIDPLIALRHLQDGLWALRARRAYQPGADWLTEARAILAPLPAFLAAGGHFPTGQ
jgi:Ser/Thr protein kinase RdoA (MazF antagonist)